MKTEITYPKKRILTILILLVFSYPIFAQLKWSFLIGGMSDNFDSGNGNYYEKPDWFTELGIDIPIRKKMSLDIALRYRSKYVSNVNNSWGSEQTYEKQGNFIELPVRLGYKFNLTSKSHINLSLGPYFSYLLAKEIDCNKNNNLYAGIEPRITYNYKWFTAGINYNAPVFYKGYENINKNFINLTVGIKFSSKHWSNIGKALIITGNIAGNIAATIEQSKKEEVSNTNISETVPYEDDVKSNNSNSYNHYVSQYQRWEQRAEQHYNSIMSSTSGNTIHMAQMKEFRTAQQNMKKVRREALKHDISIPASAWEEATVAPVGRGNNTIETGKEGNRPVKKKH